MNFSDLESFLAIIDAGSFLQASKSLGVSRSTLRRTIERLESAAGVPLLRREKDRIEPTAAGQILQERARPMVGQMGAILADVRSEGTPPVDLLRIAQVPGIPPQLIALTSHVLAELFPDAQMETLVSDNPVRLVPHDADVAYAWEQTDLDAGLTSRVVVETHLRLCASVAYLEEHGAPASPQDLEQHRLLVARIPGRDPRVLPLVGGKMMAIRPARISNHGHSLRLAAQRSEGIAFVPDPPGGVDPDSPDVVTVLPDAVGAAIRMTMVTTEPLLDHAPVRSLLQMAEQLMAQYLVADDEPGAA
jgi:DNA-binding transcriptional LysR family regulator